VLSFRKDEQDSKNTKKFYVKRLGHPEIDYKKRKNEHEIILMTLLDLALAEYE